MNSRGDRLELDFRGEIWYWRGPSPFHYVTVPEEQSREIRAVASMVSYGWGVIPVTARIGTTTWTTSLFPKDRSYLVPSRTPSARPSTSIRATRSRSV